MDGGWKQIMDDYLQEFFRFFFPRVHAAIDFGRGCQSLDKELAKIMIGAEVGDREADKLLEVHWHDGGDEWVLVHVEVQAQRDQDFAQRMCVYNGRIWERYGRPVVSLALLVDADPHFRPNRYVREKAGCRLTFTFPVVKLLSHRTTRELEDDPSPMAVVSLVQLSKLRAGSDADRRYEFKLALARALYRRGYGREDVLKLFRFLDYVLTLPAELSQRFDSELETLEKDLNMPYITSIERNALARGIEQGREQGIEQGIERGIEKGQHEGILKGVKYLLRQTLEVRFGASPESLLLKIEQCQDVAALRALHQQALTASSVEELRF
jgi:hypothetical protein